MGNETSYSKQPNRIVALVTYIIALVGLIGCLFIPFKGAEFGVGAMLALQLPAAVNALIPIAALSGITGQFPLIYSYELATWGTFTLDLGAILLLLYALITVAGIIALIPAIVNTLKEETNKNIALSAASFIEICAVAVLFMFLCAEINYAIAEDGGISAFGGWPVLAAFSAVFVMLVVQAIGYKKGSGFVKVLLALISLIAVFVTIFDIRDILPFTKDAIDGMNIEWLKAGLVNGVSGMKIINEFLSGTQISTDALTATIEIVMLITALLVLVNCALNIMGMGKRTNFFMLAVNVARYSFELICAIILILLPLFSQTLSLGLFSIVLGILALTASIIDLVRLLKGIKRRSLAAGKKPKKSKKVKVEDESEDEHVEEEEDEFALSKPLSVKAIETERRIERVKSVEPEIHEPTKKYPREEYWNTPAKTETFRETPNTSFYTPVIYNGPVDEFIRSLTNEQKVEFSKVFIERNNINFESIPEYIPGGNNKKFFTSIFIHYSSIRSLISDGLMNAIYKQNNIMR